MIRHNKIIALPTSANEVSAEVIGLGVVFKANVIKEIIDSMPIDNL